MRERIGQLRARIDGMSLRERALLFLAGVVLLFMAWDALLMAPLEARKEAKLARLEAVRGEIDAANRQIEQTLERRRADPNAELHRDLARTDARLAALDERIGATMADLIGPRRMAQVLEEMLLRQDGLEALRVESLGSAPLVAPAQGEEADSTGVYRHRLLLEAEGGYLPALAYLRELQALPWAFYWDEVHIEMRDYPRAHIRIVVSTLSLREGWIGA